MNIRSNVAGDVKRIEYDISDALESGGSALNGLRAVAPRATYQLTVPSSNSSISFSSTVSNSDLSVIDKQSVNKAIVREIKRPGANYITLSGCNSFTNASGELQFSEN